MVSFQAMNTSFHLVGLRQEQKKRMRNWFYYVESKLSRFRPESELSALNQSGGKRFLASTLLYEVTQLAWHYYQETNGIFHPFQGNNLKRLGYDRSFETMATSADFPIMGVNESESPFILFYPNMKAIQLRSDISLDLGGMAKGWSVFKAKQWLQKEGLGSGLIDGGGDIGGWGKEGTWMLGIADPFKSGHDIAQLEMKGSFGIATSSILKRSWTNQKGDQLHHLLDSITGQPSRSDLVQVTMLAPDVLTAEIYAKVLLLLGEQKGIAWMTENRPELGFVVVTKQKELVWGGNIREYARIKEGIQF